MNWTDGTPMTSEERTLLFKYLLQKFSTAQSLMLAYDNEAEILAKLLKEVDPKAEYQRVQSQDPNEGKKKE